MPFNNNTNEQIDYDDPELMNAVIAELRDVGYMNSTEIAKKKNALQIRYKLGELYAKNLLNTNVITKNPDGLWAEKLYRIYFTNEKFRKVYGGVRSRYDR